MLQNLHKMHALTGRGRISKMMVISGAGISKSTSSGQFGRFKTLSKLIEQNKEVPTSDADIRKICDSKVNIINYSDLRDLYERGGSIMEIFNPQYNDCVVLLYQIRGEGGIGHWVSLIFDRDNQIIRFFNPYGLPVDAEINLLTHERPYLTMLLQNSGMRFDINKFRFQQIDDDISTCGLHCATRCVFYDFTNEQYQRFLSSYDGKEKDYDKLVTLLCLLPLKYNITRAPAV